MNSRPYIAFDLDGVLAEYHGWAGSTEIGPPVPKMIKRVKDILEAGQFDVKIFTARLDVSMIEGTKEKTKCRNKVKAAINKWVKKNIGHKLDIIDKKTYLMVQLYDDRAIQVIPNTGETLAEKLGISENPQMLPASLKEINEHNNTNNTEVIDN